MISTIDIKIEKTSQSRIHEVDFSNVQFGKVYSDHMFMADYKDGKWQDFRIIPYQPLLLSPALATLHYAQSVFEGLKGYKDASGNALIFRPRDNFRRMNISADRMCIPQLPEDIFMGGLTELIKLDKDWIPSMPGTSLYIRPFIFAADEYIGIRPSDTYKFIIFTCPVGAYYNEAVKVKIETEYSRSFEGGTGFAKTGGNYSASLYPAKIAHEKGYHQLIWTDAKTHQFIEESGTMNVAFLINDTIYTAPANNTILKGITRDSVPSLARDMGYKVEERQFAVNELIDAIKKGILKEAFGMGTAATIAHIAIINHNGTDYDLPPVAKREFSPKVLEKLDNIKKGAEHDQYGWVYKI